MLDSIIIYTPRVDALLQKCGFAVGYICTCSDLVETCMAKYWFQDNHVVVVKSIDGVIYEVKDCNYKDIVRTMDTSYKAFLEELHEMLGKYPDFPPTLLNTFEGAIFESYDDTPAKLDAILAVVPHLDRNFLALFKSELDALTSSNTNITTLPKQFQFYRQDDGAVVYVSEVFKTTVHMSMYGVVSSTVRPVDLRELNVKFEPIERPAELDSLTSREQEIPHLYRLWDELRETRRFFL